jgi:diguanylate cyclase (GGDEF)-like protein
MLANPTPMFLLASPDPALLAAFEPILSACGAQVEVVLSADPALVSLTAPHPPALALLDVRLPGMSTGQLLAAARAEATGRSFPIVLIADTVTEEWADRLTEGIIDDVVPSTSELAFLRLRLEAVLRHHRRARELDVLRDAAALNAQTDRLTGLYNRQAILSMLFRETDRVQRMKSSLCMILFDIDDFGHWNAQLGAGPCDELLCQVADRTTRLLRSYDVLGRVGKDEFLMAERLRAEVFSTLFAVAGGAIRLTACFGIASSLGRSPVVVLRDAEQALLSAKDAGPESIHSTSDCPQAAAAPVAFLSPGSGEDLLAW